MSNDFDDKLHTQIQRLQKDKQPDRDLWPGIEFAVVARKHRQVPWMGIAASIVICAMGSWILLHGHQDSNDQMQRVVAQLDTLHQQEMSALKVAYKNTRALTTNWSTQLQDMDQAAVAIKQALKNDPQNVTLLKMLSDVYQKEIDLLKTVHEPNLQKTDTII